MEGTHEGLAAARARGQRLGRPPAMDAEMVERARRLLTQPEESITSIAALLGVSRATLYKYVPELRPENRAALESTSPRALEPGRATTP